MVRAALTAAVGPRRSRGSSGSMVVCLCVGVDVSIARLIEVLRGGDVNQKRASVPAHQLACCLKGAEMGEAMVSIRSIVC
jgi:hypothetical protein